ncbi:FTR1 family protein [Streptomyces cocklensis]|uniref:High-affinity iron transporter n=1 Tax=Actinacidiphila cocklensis TaxID=887465 RepID=A0A9W4DKT8_9ACTN|nr:iron uptake transporter permease EfeU [Actinacidiphila cocklensis]MDD1062457.1 FTR1 family protein [Actinacidiphila cocklensis]CAG6392019.1 High-affinity iron transporter [Actinacidiphila cocklensis]
MWDNAFPNFLIGLREGLEAGLVVSILVATLVRGGNTARLPQVWTGVAAAVGLSLSFGAVLTFSSQQMPTTAQEAFGGFLSVIAIGFVTAMVFWMRKNARNLSGDIKDKVNAALAMGAGGLIVTSFLAVGREGLETALFLWTNAQTAHGSSAGPLIGGGVGLVLAAAACWALYKRVLKINLTRFFTWTGFGLIVIAAGVLGYGLRDLQEGKVLPGGGSYLVDLSGQVDANAWYAQLVQGVFNLTTQMTWLQAGAYVSYLAVVMTLFVRGLHPPKPRPASTAEPVAARTAQAESAGGEEAAAPTQATPAWRLVPRWAVPAAVIAVPAVIAGVVITASGGKEAVTATIAVSPTECGKGFTAPQPGQQTFRMHNTGSQTSEVYLIDPASNAVYGEIEGLTPGTTRTLSATVGGGAYAWRCVPTGGKAVTSAVVRVGGGTSVHAVLPLSESDLAGPLAAYKGYVDAGLATLQTRAAALAADLRAGDLVQARQAWLAAHVQYAALGAAYGTFADFDARIDGRADGLPGGVDDKDFTGFHRIEYGLWHGQSAATLRPYADRLATDVTGLRKAFPTQDFDPSDLPLRSHEVLENTLQFELTGDTDEGSGSNLATADANLAGTRELITVLRPLIAARAPQQLTVADAGIARLQALLDGARNGTAWTPLGSLDATTRAKINGAIGQLLEDLAPIPDLLEIRKSA